MSRGYFGIGVYLPKNSINIGTLWRSAYIFGASFIFTIGRRYTKQASDTVKSFRYVPLYNYASFDDFKENMPMLARIVCVEISESSHPLDRFVHPQQAIYLLGAEDYGISEKILNKHTVVTIPTVRDHCLNVSTSGSLVMYDRYIKIREVKL